MNFLTSDGTAPTISIFFRRERRRKHQLSEQKGTERRKQNIWKLQRRRLGWLHQDGYIHGRPSRGWQSIMKLFNLLIV